MYSSTLKRVLPSLAGLALLATASDVLAQAVTQLAPTVKARFEASVVDYRGDIYVFNGFGPNIKIENTIEKFDVATRSWSIYGTSSVSQTTAVTHNGLVRNGKDVWVIGGRIGNHPGRVSNNVWIYNLDSKTWRAGPDMPYPVAAGGAALVNNKIHWFGGLDPIARCDVDRHFVYDLAKPAAGWQNLSQIAPMPQARNHFSTVVVNGLIYAIGGQNGHDACPGQTTRDVTLVHAYNPVTMKWQARASLPSRQSHSEPSTFEFQGYIYSVGGETDGNKVQRYNPVKNQWSTVLTLPQRLVAPIARMVDGKLLVAAGGAPSAFNPVRTTRLYTLDLPPPLNVDATDSAIDDESTTSVVDTATDTSGQTVSNDESVVISMEAEYHDSSTDTTTHRWINQTLAGSSNDDAMVTTPDNGALRAGSADSPMLSYLVYFDKPGNYYLWVRGWGDTNRSGNGQSDSLHAGINGVISTTADKIDNFPAGWNWSASTRDNIPAFITVPTSGIHSINFWMREDGLAFDKFLLSSDKDYVPSGTGPAVNDGTDVNGGGDTLSDDSGASESDNVSDTGTGTGTGTDWVV